MSRPVILPEECLSLLSTTSNKIYFLFL
jgi:hypothetical protein